MITPPILNVPTLHTHKMVHEAAISTVIIDLKSQATLNYTATTKKFNINRNTLRWCFKNQITSNSITHIESQKLLDIAQKKYLLNISTSFLFKVCFQCLKLLKFYSEIHQTTCRKTLN